MWFSRLDLLAFGKFTNVRLSLDPGFNLIFGPNEAGKTTTLRAIRQLLFGFDERTDDNFVHKNANLRVGGVVRNRAGTELEIIRRKSRNDSLRAADDVSVVDSTQWNQMLCGIDETTFCQRYGIDYEQLIAGGHQIATGTGDLGEILFATGSGVMDLNAVRKRLADEAGEIFKPLGKKQRLNLSLAEWQQKNNDVRDRQLSITAWEEADRSRTQILSDLDQKETELQQHQSELSQLRRWQQAIPLLHEFDSLEQSISSAGGAPRLPPDFGTKRQRALLLCKEADSYARSAALSIQTAEQELAKLALPNDLFSRAEEISKLIAEWGSCRKAQSDRLALLKERDQHQHAMKQLLESMGQGISEPSPDNIGLDRNYRTRLATLSRRQATLTQSHLDIQSQRVKLSERVRELREALSKLPPEQPLTHLRNALRTIQGEGDLELRLMEIRTEIGALEKDAHQQLVRLNVGQVSIDDLASLRIPDKSVVDKFEQDFQSIQTEQNLLRSRIAEFENVIQSLQLQISQLRVEFNVPTEVELHQARDKRDANWREIRNSLKSTDLPTDSSLTEFEDSMRSADALADRLRQEADRVAQLADAIADLQVNQTQLEASIDRQSQLDADRKELEDRWQSIWPRFDRPLPLPTEIPAWLAHRETLLKNQELFRRRCTEASALEDRIRVNVQLLKELLRSDPGAAPAKAATTEFETETKLTLQGSRGGQAAQRSFAWDSQSTENAGEAGDTLTSPALTLKQILLQADLMLSRAEASQSSRREVLDTLIRLEGELSTCLNHSQRIDGELLQWKSEWESAMSELNLPLDTIPDAATNYVETLNEFADHQKQARQLDSRITGIESDAQSFEITVKTLCKELAPDLIPLEVEKAVMALRDRLIASQRDATVRSTQQAKLDQAQTHQLDAAKRRNDCHVLLTELCRIAGLDSLSSPELEIASVDQLSARLSELESIERLSQKRSELEEKRERVRVRLIELAEGEELTSFLSVIRQQSHDNLAAKLTELQNSVKQINSDRDRLNHQLGAIETKLQEMFGGTDAADAEEARQQWLAQIRADAEEYLRLKLASTVLHVAIEKYREKTRAPVLKIASELFRELTLGSYDGLRVEEDDSGKPVLVGCRSDSSQTVPVEGMSEGTCDQLYLALRLASLQLEIEPRKDLPLIVDDILIQFDDARSTAALRILARIAQQRQVIFFTHHEHLLEIVKQQLPNECHIHQLKI